TPHDRLLQARRATQAVTDAIAEIRQTVVAFGIGQRGVDQLVRGGAILFGEVRCKGDADGHQESQGKCRDAPDHTGHYRTKGTYARTRRWYSKKRSPKRD